LRNCVASRVVWRVKLNHHVLLGEGNRGAVSSVLICPLKGTPTKHTVGGVGRVKEGSALH
jgi:hypothetical protein